MKTAKPITLFFYLNFRLISTGVCTEGYWRCKTSYQCIETRLVCNGLTDCDDRTDEDRDLCSSWLITLYIIF